MKKCSNCSAELKKNEAKCSACGLSLVDESAATVIKTDGDQDHTPTRISDTKAQNDIQTTTSGIGRFSVGTVLAGRYQILDLIGKGGMGEVYKAEDLELTQVVALKFLPEELADNKELLERFRGEVRTARQVSHQNVCRVFDIGETKGLYYLTMEFIEGDDLAMLLRRIGRFPSDRAIEISREIAMGLNAIHKAGILHRDLKPANIIIDSTGMARITDFGIAGLEEDVQGAESKVGTPAYMSPEQVSGKEVTKKSDIYALGLLLYEIFTGKQAFTADTIPDLLEKQKKSHPTNLSELVTGIDPMVENLISRCIAKVPERRPASALHVAMALPGGNPLQAALEAGETPTPEMIAAAPSRGALKPLVALGLLLGFIGMFSLVMYWSSKYEAHAFTPFQKSPEVLAERAKTVIANLGFDEPPADTHFRIYPNSSYLRFAKDQKNPRESWEKIRKGQPFHYYFFYRQSPEPLVPMGDDSEINLSNPPLIKPGMINVRLDVTGRLIEMTAVPQLEVQPQGQEKKLDWKKVFDEAGLDIEKFTETETKWNSRYFSNENIQWAGALADFPEIPVRINGSALNGKLVEFKIVPSWNEPSGEVQQKKKPAGPSASDIFLIVLLFLMLFGAVLLVRYNLKNGRGDVKGAIKLAIFFLVLLFCVHMLHTNWMLPYGDVINRFFGLLSEAVFDAVVIFMFYLATEPFIRKRWAEILISWNRLLNGDFRNPMIGRDVLVGFFLAICCSVFSFGVSYLEFTRNPNLIYEPFKTGNSYFLNGIVVSVGYLVQIVVSPLIAPYILLFPLLIFSLIFKKKWLAVLATILLFSIQIILQTFSGDAWVTLLPAIMVMVLNVFCLIRFGFLSATAFVFVNLCVERLTPTFDPTSFYFPSTVMAFAVTFVFAIYAYYIATAGKPLFGQGFLEEGG